MPHTIYINGYKITVTTTYSQPDNDRWKLYFYRGNEAIMYNDMCSDAANVQKK